MVRVPTKGNCFASAIDASAFWFHSVTTSALDTAGRAIAIVHKTNETKARRKLAFMEKLSLSILGLRFRGPIQSAATNHFAGLFRTRICGRMGVFGGDHTPPSFPTQGKTLTCRRKRRSWRAKE